MRLHHLEICAFGPFADTVEIDFDELAAGGLFLLTGATGAGKTSVLDAARLLVGDLLSMTAAQFTQVAMLPQGRFQAFLRASSTERHTVLQKLFRTDRFEQVERWLVDRRGATRRASEAAARGVLEACN